MAPFIQVNLGQKSVVVDNLTFGRKKAPIRAPTTKVFTEMFLYSQLQSPHSEALKIALSKGGALQRV